MGMDEFFSEMQRLRDVVVEKQIYDTSWTDDWNTLTSSMDALEDTHHAISAFVAAASKLEPKHQKRELGERYLRSYGVMQAFVIQQDAALNLHVSLGMPEPDLKPLDQIRDLRVAAAGHPTLPVAEVLRRLEASSPSEAAHIVPGSRAATLSATRTRCRFMIAPCANAF